MHLYKFGLLILLGSSLLFISCKNEVGDAMNKAKETTEKVATDATQMVKETADNVVDAVEENIEAVKENITDNEMSSSDDESTIVAPTTDPKPKQSSASSNSEGKITKPKPKTSGQASQVPVSETEVVEAPAPVSEEVEEAPAPESVPTSKPYSQTSAASNVESTNEGQVLKEVSKPTTSAVKEKVEVGSISKPKPTTSAGTTTTRIDNVPTKFSHGPFDALLRKVVSASGVVDYSLLKANIQDLNSYCKSLEDNPPSSSWSNNDKLAYWMNAYNAYTLKLITENYPLKSITDLHGGKPWDKKWINLDSKSLSLNDIENVIIRPTFKDARIHFAVNCAAKSCPPIANYAFTGRNVNSKMDALTKSFINSSSNSISKNKISVSKIFDWYKEDFGDLIDFINKYSDVQVDPNATIEYMEYDWSLNG